MSPEDAWRTEWEILSKERARTRSELQLIRAELKARLRDPVGLGGLARAHPVAAAAVGAALVALLTKVLVGRKATPDRRDAGDGPAAPSGAKWWSHLRDAAMAIAVPWLVRTITESLAGRAGADGAATPATEPSPSPPPS